MHFFKTYNPSPSVAHVVDYYWRSVIPLQQSLTQEVPTPLMQGMTFNLNRLAEKMVFGDRIMEMNDYCYLFGQPAKHRLSLSHQSGVDIFGVKFTTTGLYTLTGVDMQHIADAIVPADCIWGREIEWLCEALYEASDVVGMIQVLEQFIQKKLKKRPTLTLHPPFEAALGYMETKCIYSLQDILERTFMSQRTMERYFRTRLGLTPKRYAQICRFNAVKQILDKQPVPNWQEVVYSFGYYDQSHFIKEFKKLSGKTPVQYIDASNFAFSSLIK